MADALLLQIRLCNTAVSVRPIKGRYRACWATRDELRDRFAILQELVAARKADLDAQRARRETLQAQLSAEEVKQVRHDEGGPDRPQRDCSNTMQRFVGSGGI